MVQLLDIVGQDQAVGSLQEALAAGRLPHAMLFAGPDGVGRRTTAEALAQTLLCEHPATVRNGGRLAGLPDDFMLRQACGQCNDCRMMASSSHSDFHAVYKELAAYHDDQKVRDAVMQELGIAVVRQFLIEAAARRPGRGRGKVFVVHEADLMSQAAQNALLKTLEEPPPGVTIVLLCEQPEQMLPTTKSRCRLVRFGLLPHDFVIRKLLEKGLDKTEAAFWAAFTDGSLGRSMALSAEGLYSVKTDVLERIAAMNRAGDAELGEALTKTTEKLAEQAIRSSRIGQTELSRSLAIRQKAGAMLELISSAYRDALWQATHFDRPIVHADQPKVVAALAAKFDALQLASIIEQLSELESLLWRNVNPKTIWDNVVISCASAAPLKVG